MNATWTRRAIGCSSSVCVSAKFPQTEKLGVLVVCSISSSSSTGVKARVAAARSATRSVMWSNIGALAIDEAGQVLDDELEVRSVVGVRKQDQFGVWQVLLEDVRVDGRDDDVVAAVDHERWVRDSLEIVV